MITIKSDVNDELDDDYSFIIVMFDICSANSNISAPIISQHVTHADLFSTRLVLLSASSLSMIVICWGRKLQVIL